MATSDWLNLRGWIEGLVGWSMDNFHDALPSGDIDATVTISLPTGIWPEDIVLGRVFNLQDGFGQIQPALEGLFSATMICTVVFTTMMLTMLPTPTSRGSSSGGSWTGWEPPPPSGAYG